MTAAPPISFLPTGPTGVGAGSVERVQMILSWVRTEGQMAWERSHEKEPLAVELALPPSKYFLVRNGAPSPGNQDKSTTHSSGLDDSDSTSHSLLLCVFLNVCARACACQCVTPSAVCVFMCVCTDRNPLIHMPELCPSVNLSPGQVLTIAMTQKVNKNQKMNRFVFEGSVL